MKITSRGRVTVPHNIRRHLGLRPGDEVEFVLDGNEVIVMPASEGRPCGEKIVACHRGSRTVKMTTDEITALLGGTDEEKTS